MGSKILTAVALRDTQPFETPFVWGVPNMKFIRTTFAVTSVWVLLAGFVGAQGVVREAPTAQPWLSNPGYVAAGQESAQPSPSDIVRPRPPVASPPSGEAPAVCTSCGNSSGCSCRRSCLDSFLCPDCCKVADLGDPFKVADGCFFKEHNIQVGGWLAQSFTWNPDSPANKYNGPVTWTDRSNEYQLNELYFFLGRAADTKGCGWDYGYRVDAVYGTNYRWDTAVGLESFWNGYSEYGFALPQLYAEVAVNDLTIRAGHFISPVGYYTVGTANNFFPFIPYTYQYGEPFTHTGMTFSYKFSDNFTWANGFVRGWDNFNPNNAVPHGNPNLSWLSNATLTRENGDTLAWVGLLGQDYNAGSGDRFSNRYFQTLVYNKKFSDDVTGVLQSDFGAQQNGAVGDKPAYWYGANSYLYWNQTCRTQWGTNLEWFRDEEGFRVGQVLPSPASPAARGWNAPNGAGFAGNFWSFAFGPKHFFTPNIYGRAALRVDWYDGAKPGGLSPYNAGTKDSQELVVFDVVATF
ncbi:MAG: outer membrane beta-barrel protein [Planctomycetota bacterium]|nr:outer membrane beta-barrel protein [Planctomycetota bacterium]